MIRLALTDLDDTLIPFGASSASAYSVAAVHTLLDTGLHFGPVTGRVPSAMGWMFGGDEACCQTGAFANGQVLRIDGRIIKIIEIDSEPLQAVADYLEERDDAFLTIYDLDDPDGAALVMRDPSRADHNPSPTIARITGRLSFLDQPRYVKCNIQCSCSRAQMLELRDELNQQIEGLEFVMPSNIAFVIDILPAGWSKGVAVRELAEALGVSIDEVAVFGDSENDLSMIEAVPNSVAVSNASAEILAAARWHIGACKDDAVAHALLDIAQAASHDAMPRFMDESVEI